MCLRVAAGAGQHRLCPGLARRARSLSSGLASNAEVVVEVDCSWRQIEQRVSTHGRTCLAVVDDGTLGITDRCLFELRKVGINCAVFTARGAYPTADGIDEARDMAKRVGAGSIVGIGGGGTIDTAKAAARLHAMSGKCKQFLSSPSSVMMGEGNTGEPRTIVGGALPRVIVPTSAGAGASANERCLVWHPDDEVLVPLADTPAAERSAAVTLVDPTFGTSLNKIHTVTMALTAISACVDALVSWELASIGRTTAVRDDGLPQLGTRGLRVVAEGMPVAVSDRKNLLARELLVTGSVCAGQLAAITPAPPTQLFARAAGSLLARHSYPSVCAMVFPHVVGHLLDQANSFSTDSEVADAVERGLSRSASALLGDGNDSSALLTWINSQERDFLGGSSTLSSVDPSITSKEVATNMEMLLALEKDSDTADRVWSGSGVLDVSETIVG